MDESDDNDETEADTENDTENEDDEKYHRSLVISHSLTSCHTVMIGYIHCSEYFR